MKPFLAKLINDLFAIQFVVFVAYFGFEFLFEGIVSNYFDLNILLVVTIVFGVVSAILDHDLNNGDDKDFS